MNVRENPQPPVVGTASTGALWGVMLQELSPRHVALTMAPLPGSLPTQLPATKGPPGHGPVGLP